MAGKAVLVIDMPNGCDECPLNSHTEYDFDVCWVTQGKGGCPLRPLPKKKDVPPNYGMMVGDPRGEGWNECLEEILNESSTCD